MFHENARTKQNMGGTWHGAVRKHLEVIQDQRRFQLSPLELSHNLSKPFLPHLHVQVMTTIL